MQARTQATNARETDIARSYRDGASLRELGRRYGITPDQARYILVRQGVSRRPALKPTKADPATAWKRLVEGEKATQVAEDYDYSGVASLYTMLRQHGYKPRSLHLVEHGSLSSYTYGCRCEECRAAKSAYAREWSRRARVEVGVRRHGLRSTYNRGCRCDRCRAANSAYTKEQKRKKREELRPT